MTLAAVSLDDKYALEEGRVFLTGTQALVRLAFEQIKSMGEWDDTLVIFLSATGASAEIMVRDDGHDPAAPLGSAATYLCLGPGWSTCSNTPFRRHKTWTHEGGTSTPLVVSWPKGIAARGELRHNPGHVIDFVPTVLELTGAEPPAEAPPSPGKSLVPLFAENGDGSVSHDSLWWFHDGHKAIRMDDWKAVAPVGERSAIVEPHPARVAQDHDSLRFSTSSASRAGDSPLSGWVRTIRIFSCCSAMVGNYRSRGECPTAWVAADVSA